MKIQTDTLHNFTLHYPLEHLAPLEKKLFIDIETTGFSAAGASFEDVRLFAQNVDSHVKIKAAGGISSLSDAEEFLRLGADRLGTSRIVKIAKAQEGSGY